MATQLRPVPIADTFEAFVIVSSAHVMGQVRPLDSADTLDDCKSLAVGRVPHKGHFFIRHTNALTGAAMLSFYVVKKAKPTLRYHNYQHRMIADLYAEHLFDLAGDML